MINTVRPTQIPTTEIADARLVWIGPDDRGHPRHAHRAKEEPVNERHEVAGPDVDLDIDEVRDRQCLRITTE